MSDLLGVDGGDRYFGELDGGFEMTNASVDVVDYVPRDNNDLIKVYGAYVAKLVTRHNRVTTNYDDLLQHVWLKLIEVDVLDKYKKSLGHLPKFLTGHAAATYLRLPWHSFLNRVQRGVSEERVYAQVFERDQGTCHRCSRDMTRLQSALKAIQGSGCYSDVEAKLCVYLGVDVLPDRLWVVEKGGKTTCLACAQAFKVSGASYRWYPLPHKGHWTSPMALYVREDVERLRLVLEGEKDRQVDESADPSSVFSKSLFKQYLARAVHNIYANWCRTRDRRYKETYKGYDEASGRHWEDTLQDPFGARQEAIVDLVSAIRTIAGDSSSEADVIHLFDSGRYSVEDVTARIRTRQAAG